MLLVWETDLVDVTFWGVGVDENIPISVEEALPFVVHWDTLCCAYHISIQALRYVGLFGDDGIELTKSRLHSLNNMSLKRSKVVLDRNQICSVGIFFQDLLI